MQMLESLFARALKLEPPWAITKVDFQEDEGVIRVYIDFPRGSVFCCPACGKKVKAYATTEKEWSGVNPPDKAIVLCVDEKSQIQALDRTQPGLPLKK